MKYFLLLAFLCTSSLFAKDKVQYPLVYLTWEKDPATTMKVQWITSKKETSNTLYVQEAKKTNKDWIKIEARAFSLGQKEKQVVHKAHLEHLEPNTIYQCKIGNDKKIIRFRTLPQTLDGESLRFVVGGDAYSNSLKRFQKMTKTAAKQNPRFCVIGGDIAYSAPKKKGDDRFYEWEKFFSVWMKEMIDADGCMIPLLVGIGNHEVIGRYECTPDDAPMYYALFEKGYYDIAFGKYLHFIFLDSEHTHPVKGLQTIWLHETLRRNPGFTHRFGICHVGPYPSIGSYKLKIRKNIRKHWVPLFEQYKLHVFFENHDHGYKRTFPLLQDKSDPRGVVYIGDGSWGVNPREPKERPYLACTKQEQQVTVVELTNTKRTFRSVNVKGRVIDQYEQDVQR
jgi:acid phosphatase type 7